jgi:ArsR family transcriptional regulator, arsenate/arsenite/antimonite-responsive transcriptional repressor / arsenate reductase (thioredoxin)
MYFDWMTRQESVVPPGFLRQAGHPLRWRILRELARSDRQVRELTALLGQPQSLVSYHLGQLRSGELVTARRSSADGRDAYYSLDLARCGELLTAAGAALHPGLRLVQPPPPGLIKAHSRVLFVCTGNSARSQIAEAFAQHLSGGAVEAASAGSCPKPLHPNAIRVMGEYGIDIADRTSKHLDTFAGQRFGYVISVCDRVREICPEFPGQPQAVHWSIPDPASAGDTDEQTYPAFRAVAADLRTRTGFLLARVAQRSGPAPG